MKKSKILIVEDDVAILTGLTDLLRGEGFEVFSATDGKKALSLYNQEHPDVMIVDIMIPEKNGLEVCKEIRKVDPVVSLLILTAKNQEIDKVVGLQLGADDYLAKPFGIHELLARVQALLRRKQIRPNLMKNKDPLTFGPIRIDARKMEGYKGKKVFSLSEREIQLLRLFTAHANEVLERDMILNVVWGISYVGTTRTLDQHIVKLRQKIEDDPSSPKYIRTVHGVGYRFCPPT